MRRGALISIGAWCLGLTTFSACAQVIGLGSERSHGDTDAGSDAGSLVDATNEKKPCTGSILWTKRFGDAGSQFATSIVPDGAGGVYIAGYFESALDLGGTPIISNGGTDIFLARLDSEGNELWARSFGDEEDQRGVLSLTLVTGGVILAGELRASADFGGGLHVSSGLADGVLVRFDADGNFLWDRFVVGPSPVHSELVTNVAIGSAGSLYLGVVFTGTVTFMEKTYVSQGMKDILLSKLDSDPKEVWTRQFGGSGDEAPNWVGADAIGRPIMAGAAAGSLSIGQEVLPSTAGWDVLLGSYEATAGSALTTRRYGGVGDTDVTRIVGYPLDDDLIVTGRLRFGVELDLGNGPISADEGAFLGVLGADFEPVATRAIANLLVPDGVAPDGQGNVWVGGTFTSVAEFGAKAIATNGLKDAVLMKLGPELETLSVLRMGSVGDDALHGVAVDPGTGNVFAFGQFSETLSFESDDATCADLTSAGATDLMLVKLAP